MKIPRNLLLLYISSFLIGFSFGYFRWIIPILIMKTEGAVILGTVFTFSSFITAFVAFSGGILSDKYGRRLVIVGGTFLFAMGATLLLASQVISVFLVFGALFIYTSPAFYRPAVDALITESSDRAFLGRAFSVMPVLTLTGMSSGSVILGYITENVGLFTAASVSFTCAWMAVFIRMLITSPGSRSEHSSSGFSFSQIRAVTEKKYLIFFALIVVGTGLISWFGAYFPNFLSEIMLLGEKNIGILFSILSISQAVMQPVAGWFIDRFDERSALAINLGGSGVFVLLFIFFSRINVTAAIISIVISSSLSAFYNVGYSVYIARATQEDTRGTVYGGMETLGSLSSVPAPLVGALLWEKSPYLPFIVFGFSNLCFISLLIKTRVKNEKNS
jgi:MFS family permease